MDEGESESDGADDDDVDAASIRILAPPVYCSSNKLPCNAWLLIDNHFDAGVDSTIVTCHTNANTCCASPIPSFTSMSMANPCVPNYEYEVNANMSAGNPISFVRGIPQCSRPESNSVRCLFDQRNYMRNECFSLAVR